MKILILFFLMSFGFANATTLHLSEILKKGYHFSQVQYSAFDQPKEAQGKDTEEYLAAILKDAKDNIDRTYVHLRELDVDVAIDPVALGPVEIILEEKTNHLDIKKLKTCADRSLPLLKSVIFHRSLKQVDLQSKAEAILAENRGIIGGLQHGILCGIHMGKYGDLLQENPVEEIKLASFLLKESEFTVMNYLKILNILKGSDSFIGIKFLRYLKISFLVDSYRGKKTRDAFNIKGIKDRFAATYLLDSKQSFDNGVIVEVNNDEQRAELERIFQKVADELN